MNNLKRFDLYFGDCLVVDPNRVAILEEDLIYILETV